jgi:hypothetical protein
LNRLSHGDQAIVSTLVFLEVLGALRKKIVRKESFAGPLTPAIKKNIQTKIEQKIAEFMTKVAELTRQGKVLLADPDMRLRNYLRNVLSIFSPYKGYLEHSPANKPDKYIYEGLGHWDMQHAVNAQELNAGELVSCDSKFNDLRNISKFASMTITTIIP